MLVAAGPDHRRVRHGDVVRLRESNRPGVAILRVGALRLRPGAVTIRLFMACLRKFLDPVNGELLRQLFHPKSFKLNCLLIKT